jgi:hypothetical protein
MSRPSPLELFKYANTILPLKGYLSHAGDGRLSPRIPAQSIVWAMIVCMILRKSSFLAIERTVHTTKCASLPIARRFGNDALDYFTELVDVQSTRTAMVTVLRWAKRNKAFDQSYRIGLAIDGVTSGHSVRRCCSMCRPVYDEAKRVIGYHHSGTVISVVGTGLTLPFDTEPYGPGDSEYAAGQRLLQRAWAALGPRYAQYLVVDGGFATAPFLHTADSDGVPVVARLKENLPTLLAAARKRFEARRPQQEFMDNKDHVAIWDAENFEPWETLNWPHVRVLRYRQTKPDGTVIDAYWFTKLPLSHFGSRALYRACKSRWEIENQGFNDAKNRYGLKHIRHHERNSILFLWLMTFLSMMIERLYRIRFLHRGKHPIRSAVELCHLLWLSLELVGSYNSS